MQVLASNTILPAGCPPIAISKKHLGRDIVVLCFPSKRKWQWLPQNLSCAAFTCSAYLFQTTIRWLCKVSFYSLIEKRAPTCSWNIKLDAAWKKHLYIVNSDEQRTAQKVCPPVENALTTFPPFLALYSCAFVSWHPYQLYAIAFPTTLASRMNLEQFQPGFKFLVEIDSFLWMP